MLKNNCHSLSPQTIPYMLPQTSFLNTTLVFLWSHKSSLDTLKLTWS